jgi:hypothetical protein
MKTVKQINDEIKSVQEFYLDKSKFTDNELKKGIARVKYLTACRNYLELNPREEHLKDQLDKFNTQIRLIGEGFNKWHIGSNVTGDTKKDESRYNSQMGRANIRSKIEVLEYLLN